MRLAFFANTAASFVWFRLPLLRQLVEAGHAVWVLAPEDEHALEISQRTGASFLPVRMRRDLKAPLQDARALRDLRRALRLIRPELLLSYSPKGVLLGGLAAKAGGVPRAYGMLSGLGYAGQPATSLKGRLRRQAFLRALRAVGATTHGLIVLNTDLLRVAKEERLAPPARVQLLDGEGIDTAQFTRRTPVAGAPLHFLQVSRLVHEKGVATFVEAARQVHATHPQVRFSVVGGEEVGKHPDAIPSDTLRRWREEGVVELLGYRRDVPALLASADVFVLPSHHEGLPMSTMEAMATGLAVLTTNAVGTRETVEEGVNGHLFPVGDAQALAKHMVALIEAPERVITYGAASRRIACERFDTRVINARLMGLLQIQAP